MESAFRPADRLTTAASWTVSACAVHCIVTPFVIGLMPLIGFGLSTTAWFEWSTLGLAAALGGAGLGWSFVRVHHSARPLALLCAGLSIIAGAHLLFAEHGAAHAVGALLGAMMIFVAGRLNHSLVHRHR